MARRLRARRVRDRRDRMSLRVRKFSRWYENVMPAAARPNLLQKTYGGVVPLGDSALLGPSHFDSGLILTGGDRLAGDCLEGILSYPPPFRFRRWTAEQYVALA